MLTAVLKRRGGRSGFRAGAPAPPSPIAITCVRQVLSISPFLKTCVWGTRSRMPSSFSAAWTLFSGRWTADVRLRRIKRHVCHAVEFYPFLYLSQEGHYYRSVS